MQVTDELIDVAAGAITNARRGRQGIDPDSDVLNHVSPEDRANALEDARAALEAAAAYSE